MSEPKNPGAVDPDSRRRGWEITDAHVKPLAWLALALTVMTIATMGISQLYISMMDGEIEGEREPRNPMADYADVPTAPFLQDRMTRVTDIEEYRRQEERITGGYHWIAPSEGLVSLPLQRAAELMLEEDRFPHRPESQQ